jgi:hypothetical protein
MTGKEVETVAVLLKRVRERADDLLTAAECLRTKPHGPEAAAQDYAKIATDMAKAMHSLAAALEMVTIEIAELRAMVDAYRGAETFPPNTALGRRVGIDR